MMHRDVHTLVANHIRHPLDLLNITCAYLHSLMLGPACEGSTGPAPTFALHMLAGLPYLTHQLSDDTASN